MYHDIKFTLHYFAKEGEWRLYTDSGQYVAFKELSRLEHAVRQLLKGNANLTLHMLKVDEDK